VPRSQLLAWARGGAAPAHASKSYIDELTLGHILELVAELNDKHWAAHWASELQGCGGGCGRGAILYSWLQSLGVQFFPGKFIKADFANLLRDLRRACRQQACSRPNLSLPARPLIESVLPKKMRPATPATSPTPSSPAESPSADSPADLIDLPTNLPATSTPSSNPPCADTLPGGPPTSSSPASSRLSLRLTIPVPEGTYISLRNANEKLQSEAQHLRMQEAELRLELRGEQGRHDETAEIADALRLRVAELISETERLQRALDSKQIRSSELNLKHRAAMDKLKVKGGELEKKLRNKEEELEQVLKDAKRASNKHGRAVQELQGQLAKAGANLQAGWEQVAGLRADLQVAVVCASTAADAQCIAEAAARAADERAEQAEAQLKRAEAELDEKRAALKAAPSRTQAWHEAEEARRHADAAAGERTAQLERDCQQLREGGLKALELIAGLESQLRSEQTRRGLLAADLETARLKLAKVEEKPQDTTLRNQQRREAGLRDELDAARATVAELQTRVQQLAAMPLGQRGQEPSQAARPLQQVRTRDAADAPFSARSLEYMCRLVDESNGSFEGAATANALVLGMHYGGRNSGRLVTRRLSSVAIR